MPANPTLTAARAAAVLLLLLASSPALARGYYGRPPGVPSAAELELLHARVGRVSVYVENIFDPEGDPRERGWFYRATNALHPRTHESVARAQLLFQEGEPLRAERLAESERILRGRAYFADAWVVPVAYDRAANVVDVAVTVRDVWTLSPDVSFSRTGGSNRNRFNIQEENLLGTGTAIQLAHLSNVDRTSTVASVATPTLLDSRWSLNASFANNSDGHVRSLELGRPFFSLDAKNGFDLIAQDGTSQVSRYDHGSIVDQFDEQSRTVQAYYAWSHGLVDGWTTRWYAGVRIDDALFRADPRTSLPARVLPPERRLTYPYIAWERDEDRWAKVENQDKIGRTEDVYFGRSTYLELGQAAGLFGADRTALIPRLSISEGFDLGHAQRLFVSGTANGRFEDGRLDAGIANAGGRYYWLQSLHELLYFSLSGTLSKRLDPESQVLLGGDTGLRGYPMRFQTGSALGLATLEERFYSDWYPFRLVRVGGAVFFDAGRTWGRGPVGAPPLGLLRDVGIGIRLGNSRSGLGSVLHIDLSWALDNTLGARRLQITVQTLATY